MTIQTHPHYGEIVTSLAGLKRAMSAEGATVELVSATVPDGVTMPAYRTAAIGEPRRVVKRQTNGFYVEPFEGQMTTGGKPMGRTWFEYGSASRWSFALQSGYSLATVSDGDGYSRTYRIGVEAAA